MFPDAFPNILPLRAIVLQSLFLLMAIAIESTVLKRRMPLTPKDSVYFATAINLLCVILGWLALFIFLNMANILPPGIQVPLISFIFFDQWSGETATLLIVSCFIIFFVSLGIKLLGLLGLRLLLEMDKTIEKKPEEQPAEPVPTKFFRELRQEPSALRSEITTLLFANAWSYSSILAVLVLRQALL
ncbi:MAG TPA: filament integrity protein FraC [Coleofasciculaceae cyanobacterium]